MVRLTRIYTRLGDDGDTHLGDMSRARKDSPRVAAYGDVDELNAAIGVARTRPIAPRADGWLEVIQNDLFDLGADLCVPPDDGESGRLRIAPAQVERLERWCDEVNDDLPDLASFVLPGGSPGAAALHHARTVCRRAERSTVTLAGASRSRRRRWRTSTGCRTCCSSWRARRTATRAATCCGSPGRAAPASALGAREADPPGVAVDLGQAHLQLLARLGAALERATTAGSATWTVALPSRTSTTTAAKRSPSRPASTAASTRSTAARSAFLSRPPASAMIAGTASNPASTHSGGRRPAQWARTISLA